MFDYSDTIYTMAAMVIFSILALNTNQIMLRNNLIQQETELEFSGITYAQQLVEQLRFRTFQEIGDMNGDTLSTTTEYGPLFAAIQVNFVAKNNTETVLSDSDHRRVRIRVSSPFMPNTVQMEFVKSK